MGGWAYCCQTNSGLYWLDFTSADGCWCVSDWYSSVFKCHSDSLRFESFLNWSAGSSSSTSWVAWKVQLKSAAVITRLIAVGISTIPVLSVSTATMKNSLKASCGDTELVSTIYKTEKKKRCVLKSVDDLNLYFRIYRLSWRESKVSELLFRPWRPHEPAPQQQSDGPCLLALSAVSSQHIPAVPHQTLDFYLREALILPYQLFSSFVVSCEPWAVSTSSAQLLPFSITPS